MQVKLSFPARIMLALAAGAIAGAVTEYNMPRVVDDVLLTLLVLAAGAGMGYLWAREGLPRGRRALEGLFLGLATMAVGGASMALLAYLAGWSPRVSATAGLASGWYSLAGPLIAQYDAGLGFAAFLGNLARELLHISLYPVLASRGLGCPAIALGGATTMDTGLPVVVKYGGGEAGAVALGQGATITGLAPAASGFVLLGH